MRISVILPTLNEETSLKALLPQFAADAVYEILVADGGSTDRTCEVAQGLGARVLQARRGRGAQMNAGAAEAVGDLLWFLHADSTPPVDWRDQIQRALSSPEIIGGGFRSVINAPGPGYRLLDLAGRVRFSLQRTLYGDQGIFVRREAFERLGGFADWTALEDLDFSFRLSHLGKVCLLPGVLKTSARRWQADGWWATVIRHAPMALSYRPFTLGVMAKAPVPGQVKTRLIPTFTPEQAADLATKLLWETVESVQQLPQIRTVVAVASGGEGSDPARGQTPVVLVRRLLPRPIPLVAQGEGDLGERLWQFFRQAFQEGSHGVIALGADHPGLPVEYLRQAVAILRKGGDRLVLGPTEDGGYYLIGLNRPHPELFEGIPWSTAEVLKVTLQRAKRLGLPVLQLPPWFDLDRPEDLKKIGDTPHGGA